MNQRLIEQEMIEEFEQLILPTYEDVYEDGRFEDIIETPIFVAPLAPMTIRYYEKETQADGPVIKMGKVGIQHSLLGLIWIERKHASDPWIVVGKRFKGTTLSKDYQF